MTSILKTDEIQSQNGGAVVKMQTLKHPSASGNNLELGSDGNVSITNTLSAGTIGGGVTITDGANPHGWEHIKTIAYSADTATSSTGTTATKMSNVVSSKYSAYKLIIRWGCATDDKDIYFRFLDASDAVVSTSQYYYAYQLVSHTGGEGQNFNGSTASFAQVGNDIVGGSIGFNCEMLLYNCIASSSDYPQVDGHTLTATSDSPARPQAMYRQTGYDDGHYYQMGTGSVNYNTESYVTGFVLYFESDASVEKDSWWSCYGLKLPTAD
tara:strand:+ start:977 stop:1780 length:804 start_codon:yes stop_codon:yes gene_type:complete